MKKWFLCFFGLFLFLGFASEALAHSRGDRRDARRFRAEREYRQHDGHRHRNHGRRDYRRHRHHHHNYRRHHHRYYYGEPYYHGGYYYPGVVVHLDPFGWLRPAPVVVEQVVVEKPAPAYEEDDSDVTSLSELEKRLEKLRTRAARHFMQKTPMPYDVFDGLSPPERRAYGEEWDRHMLLEGGKGPFFRKEWR